MNLAKTNIIFLNPQLSINNSLKYNKLKFNKEEFNKLINRRFDIIHEFSVNELI